MILGGRGNDILLGSVDGSNGGSVLSRLEKKEPEEVTMSLSSSPVSLGV